MAEDAAPPDFSALPEVVWVNVLSYLSLDEKACIARTCYRLNECFNHPSLWSIVKLHLTNAAASTNYSLTRRFGKCFQDITLICSLYQIEKQSEVRDLITMLANLCSALRKLTLDVSSSPNKLDRAGRHARKVEIQPLVDLLVRASCLTSFTLLSWPMHQGIDCPSALSLLQQNAQSKKLQKLNLFWLDAQSASWTTQNSSLPPADEVRATITYLTQLTSLVLRSSMVSKSLIEELAKPNRAELLRFGILITYSRNEGLSNLCEIPASSWQKLTGHSPNIKVDITIGNRVPSTDLMECLNEYIPLVSINFMKYSLCELECLVSLTERFHGSLRKFVCFAGAVDMHYDKVLLSMTERSENMDYFIYSGILTAETVLKLAAVRQHKWYNFHVKPSNIRCIYMNKEDDDGVVKQAEDGSFYLSSIEKLRNENMEDEGKEEKLQALFSEVSEITGRNYITKANNDSPAFISERIFNQLT